MTFRPKPKNPDFSRLKSTLAQMKLSDNALYETLATMIDWLTQFKLKTEKDIADINNSVNNIISIINTVADKFRTYITDLDESLNLPNSRQLLAGTNVTFDKTVPNKLTINVSASVLDHVALSDGAAGVNPPQIIHDGSGNFIYIPYNP